MIYKKTSQKRIRKTISHQTSMGQKYSKAPTHCHHPFVCVSLFLSLCLPQIPPTEPIFATQHDTTQHNISNRQQPNQPKPDHPSAQFVHQKEKPSASNKTGKEKARKTDDQKKKKNNAKKTDFPVPI